MISRDVYLDSIQCFYFILLSSDVNTSLQYTVLSFSLLFRVGRTLGFLRCGKNINSGVFSKRLLRAAYCFAN